MPRAIAEINKELQLKRATVAKTTAAITARETKKVEQAKIVADLRPRINKLSDLIADNTKALKDSKTKKEHKKGLEDQKKKAEIELAPLDKKMEAALAEHKVCESLIATLKRTDQPIYDTIDKLEAELALATKGQKAYGEERQRFKNWYAGEVNKLKTFATTAVEAAKAAEALRVRTVTQLEKGALEMARASAKQARVAADLTLKNAGSFEKAAGDLNTKREAGRNLKPTEYNIVPADTQIFATFNKAVLLLFAEQDQWSAKVKQAVAEAEESAAEAETWAAAGAKTTASTGAILAAALAAMGKLDADISARISHHWGKEIVDHGAAFTALITTIRSDKAKLDVAMKTYEQASIYVPESLDRVRLLAGRIQAGCAKAVASVAAGSRAALAKPMADLKALSEKTTKFMTGYESDAVKALAELDKLRLAIEALS